MLVSCWGGGVEDGEQEGLERLPVCQEGETGEHGGLWTMHRRQMVSFVACTGRHERVRAPLFCSGGDQGLRDMRMGRPLDDLFISALITPPPESPGQVNSSFYSPHSMPTRNLGCGSIPRSIRSPGLVSVRSVQPISRVMFVLPHFDAEHVSLR